MRPWLASLPAADTETLTARNKEGQSECSTAAPLFLLSLLPRCPGQARTLPGGMLRRIDCSPTPRRRLSTPVQAPPSSTRCPRSSSHRTTAPSRHAGARGGSGTWPGIWRGTSPSGSRICTCCLAHCTLHPPHPLPRTPVLLPAGAIQRIQDPWTHPRQGARQRCGSAGGDVPG